MQLSPRFRIVAVVGVLALIGITSCKKADPVGPDAPLPAKEKVLAYVVARCEDCKVKLVALEVIVEPTGGSQDTTAARAAWIASRHYYELIRAVPEWYQPAFHNAVAAWWNKNPGSGFHFLEKNIFVSSPDMKMLEPYVENIVQTVQPTIPNGLKNAGVTDDGIFHGLKVMLADIDTIKLSGLDARYSNNSYNDCLSNLEGLDTVYSYYRDLIRTPAPSTDSLFLSRLAATRQVLQSAGSLQSLDKIAFRTQTLPALQDALRQVAAILKVTL